MNSFTITSQGTIQQTRPNLHLICFPLVNLKVIWLMWSQELQTTFWVETATGKEERRSMGDTHSPESCRGQNKKSLRCEPSWETHWHKSLHRSPTRDSCTRLQSAPLSFLWIGELRAAPRWPPAECQGTPLSRVRATHIQPYFLPGWVLWRREGICNNGRW